MSRISDDRFHENLVDLDKTGGGNHSSSPKKTRRTNPKQIVGAIRELSEQILGSEKGVPEIDSNNLAKKLRESFRIIAIEYRQKDNLRSTAPDLRSMTESQILLEVLSGK
jgi:hypothetical protein